MGVPGDGQCSPPCVLSRNAVSGALILWSAGTAARPRRAGGRGAGAALGLRRLAGRRAAGRARRPRRAAGGARSAAARGGLLRRARARGALLLRRLLVALAPVVGDVEARALEQEPGAAGWHTLRLRAAFGAALRRLV